jgi:hypothetical protein
VLNTLTEHDFHDAFKGAEALGTGAYVQKDYFEGDGGQ